ncbi:MAG: hypothetical protein QMC80_00670 [Thermoplasmatales archaeon]|nr:hypothetical protein [Thermoplasmatales archaeon]
MTRIRFTEHYKKDPETNIDRVMVTHYILTSRKKLLGGNIFKIDKRVKKGYEVYILFSYDRKEDAIWVINAKKRKG